MIADELQSLLKHLIKDAKVIPSSAVSKWLELSDNSMARKRVLEELRDFVEELKSK